MPRVIALLFAVTAAACFDPTGPDAVLGTPFQLKRGEIAALPDDVRMRFDTVKADSRCPIDAVCITAGDATVALTLLKSGGTEARELHTMPAQSQFSYSKYTVRLTELQPYPRASQPTKPEDYVGTFVVQNQ